MLLRISSFSIFFGNYIDSNDTGYLEVIMCQVFYASTANLANF